MKQDLPGICNKLSIKSLELPCPENLSDSEALLFGK